MLLVFTDAGTEHTWNESGDRACTGSLDDPPEDEEGHVRRYCGDNRSDGHGNDPADKGSSVPVNVAETSIDSGRRSEGNAESHEDRGYLAGSETELGSDAGGDYRGCRCAQRGKPEQHTQHDRNPSGGASRVGLSGSAIRDPGGARTDG
jgi:hypothetical protein